MDKACIYTFTEPAIKYRQADIDRLRRAAAALDGAIKELRPLTNRHETRNAAATEQLKKARQLFNSLTDSANHHQRVLDAENG